MPLLDCTVRPNGTSIVTGSLRSPNNLHALHVLEAQTLSTNRPNFPRRQSFPGNFTESKLRPYFQG